MDIDREYCYWSLRSAHHERSTPAIALFLRIANMFAQEGTDAPDGTARAGWYGARRTYGRA